MKIIPFIIIALCSIQTVLAAEELTDPCTTCMPKFLKETNPSIVMILCYEESNRRHIQGSGFFVSKKGDVLTSYHLIAGQKNILIRTADKNSYEVTTIIEINAFGDLAKLAVNIPEEMVTPVQFSDKQPSRGDDIVVIGHPLGHQQNISYGKISSLLPIAGLGNLLQFTAPITIGSSGSPIFNLSGRVVGVASFMLFSGPNQPNLNYAVPANQFIRL